MCRTVRFAAFLLAAAPVLASPQDPSPPAGTSAATPSRIVVLRVLDRLERPVAGVTACLLPECAKAPTQTVDEAVRVVLPAEPAGGRARRLRLQAPGFAPAEMDLPAEGSPPLVVSLKASGSVTVAFLSLDEKREDSLVVSLAPGPGIGTNRPVKSVAERKLTLPPRPKSAKAVFDDVPAGTWALSWNGPNVANGTKAVTVAAVPVDVGTLPLQRGITVEGAVRDDLGSPVAGARVLVLARAVFDRSDPYFDEARTAADGGFSISGAPAGEPISWVVRSSGHMKAEGILGGETRLEIVVERAQHVSGRLVDPDGLPFREAQIVVRYVTDRSSRNHASKIEIDGDGGFSFHREMPSKTRVEVKAKGLRQARRELEPLAETGWPKELSLGEIRLERGRTIRGRVVDGGSGLALAGVALKTSVAQRDGKAIVFDEQESVSVEDGSFEISGIAPKEPVALSARKDGYAPRNLDLGGTDDDVEVVLGRGGRVEGRLCGRPFELSRSEIWMTSQPNVNSRKGAQKADATGRFVFTGVETGSMTFTRAWVYENPLMPGAYGAMVGGTKATIVVEEGRTSTIALGCDGIRLSGLFLREGSPLAAKVVVLSGPGGAEPDAMTDAAGGFSLFVPVPGPYEPYIDEAPASGLKWAPVACNVPAGGLDGCLLDLRPVPAQEKP
ncbi:MAG: hypothetical protein IPF66_17650 [Holophagales bacterium]|nr:hypothetical protein [Holophagales bacterium]